MFFARAEPGYIRPRMYVTTRSSLQEEFGPPTPIDAAFPGGETINFAGAVFDPFVTVDWPYDGSKLYFAATNSFADFDLYEATWIVPSVDLNGDSSINVSDIDELIAKIVDGDYASELDLYQDGMLDEADVNGWLSLAAQSHGYVAPFVAGDANLDGSVDSQDLNALGLNWNQATTTWSGGDFDADGLVDAADLNLLALNWQHTLAQATPVPEPAGFASLLLALAVITCCSLRQAHPKQS